MDIVIVQWLYECGGLGELQEQCHEYRSKPLEASGIYTFNLTIDIMLLLDYNPKIGELILHHPNRAWPILQQVVYSALSTLEWLPALKSPSQLLLLIRLVSIPSLSGYIVEHTCDLPSQSEGPRFCRITGTIHSMSLPEKYTEHAVFSCPNDGCNGRGDNCYISMHVAGASESTTVGREWVCYTCGSQLVEDMSCRTLADRVKLILIPCDSLEPYGSGWRLQGISAVVRRELCSGISLGSKVTLVGVPSHRLTTQSHRTFVDVTIEVSNVLPEPKGICLPLSAVPESITDIWRACQYSPWVFLPTLASSFAAEVCPPGCYHRLKMAILLSLVSSECQHQEGRPGFINLLVYGSDSKTVQHLLTVGGQIAATFLRHTSINDLGATHRKCEGTFVDGGSLLLADGGVCVIGNLSASGKDTREILQKVLETSQIAMSTSKQLDGAELRWKLNCLVWASVDQQDMKKPYARADRDAMKEHSLQDVSSISKGLADHFELVIVNDPADLATQDHLHDVLMEHILNSGTNRHCAEHVLQLPDLQQFLSVASQLEVELTENAAKLLRAFYIASRKVRTSVSYATDIPIKALSSLNAIACAHAKFNLRSKALVQDAVLSIFLYEESLTSRFGYSVLGVSPCPHFKPNTAVASYIGREFDGYLKTLQKQIVEFCSFQGVAVSQHEE